MKSTFTKIECQVCKKGKLVYEKGVSGGLRQFKCTNCGTFHFITDIDKLSHYREAGGENITDLK